MHSFAYSRPDTLADALAALAADPDATALSGGQTLLPVLRARLAAPTRLIDIGRLPELRGIRIAGDRLEIAAGETHAAVAASALVQDALPALASLASGIGDPQVRNRGTIGGSIANNDPSACYPSAALALDAVIQTSRRSVAADAFFTGMFTTALEPGEIVTAISLPRCDKAVYLKFANPASRFALIGVFSAKLQGQTRIAITGGGAGVFRWSAAERHMDAGGALAGLATVALDADHFNGDIHASVAYRIQLARIVTQRALAMLAA